MYIFWLAKRLPEKSTPTVVGNPQTTQRFFCKKKTRNLFGQPADSAKIHFATGCVGKGGCFCCS